MDHYVIKNTDLRLTLDVDGGICWAQLKDLQNDRLWPRALLLALEIQDRAQQRWDRLDSVRVDHVVAADTSIQLIASDRSRGIAVPISLALSDGTLSVTVNPSDIREDKAVLYRLFAIDLLPGMMQVDRAGELLLPINTGVVCKPVDKPARSDRFLIYGEQSRWELLPTMPVCSVQTPTGGLIALAASAPAETECRVSTDGQGNGRVGLSFFLRGHDTDPVEPLKREIQFIPIPPGRDMTVFTAGVLRRYITEELGKPTLLQRAEESPEVAHLLGAYIMKLFYGIQLQGHAVQQQDESSKPKFLVTMTFDEARAGLKSLHDAGVARVYTQNVGWNLLGHDGAYPTRFPVEERVGGERSFRELIAAGHDMGYAMTVHDNYIDGYEASADFDPEVVVVDCLGQMQIRGFWGGGPSYLFWPMAFQHRHLEAEMLRVKELGIRGPYYLDGMGCPLYMNYHPRHRGSRTELARGVDRLLTAARKIYGSVATETGFLYCCITPDLVANPGGDSLMKLANPSWPITALLDRCVPLWQLAMSGLVVTENQGIGWTDTMRALLYAQHPRYEWATRAGVHPVLDKAMIRKIKFRYDLLIKRFGYLRTLQMTDYRRERDVETTAFEDGTSITADFATEELKVNGERIDRPADV